MTGQQDIRARRCAAFAAELAEIDASGLRRSLDPPPPLTDFRSNDYLGLTRHPAVRAAVHAAIDREGTGAGAARLLGGASAAAALLEQETAEWLGAEAALLFPSGYQANLGLVTTLAGPQDAVISDRLVHASLIDACRLSRAKIRVHDHADLGDLERKLEAARGARRRLVLTEGVFGMDGDVPPLAEIHELCVAHDAWLVVDEAHAAGLLGPEGAGAWAAAGGPEDGALAARIVTCGKVLGAAGALVVGDRTLRDLCVHRARPFVFTTAPAPATIAAARSAVRIVREDGALRAEPTRLARRLARRLGLSAPDAAIVPLLVGDAEAAMDLAARVRGHGFDVRGVRPPSVPRGTARLRITCHATNTESEIDALADALLAELGSGRARPAAAAREGALGREGRTLFVAGTDTGVGKTVVAAAWMQALRRAGEPCCYWKPVQTGPDDDTAAVASLASLSPDEYEMPAVTLPLPASPHQAARAAGLDCIRLSELQASLDALRAARPAGTAFIVELAGGLLVPYGDGNLQIDWLAAACRQGAGIVLVARSGLGTLNHTLLSCEALRARGVEVDTLVLVGPEHPSNRETLAELARSRRLLELWPLAPLGAPSLARWVDERLVPSVPGAGR